jgi:transcriptional regulator with XRE-family HTH domain
MSTVGGRIKYARTARGLTQDQLAAKVGVSKGAVSQWEGNIIRGLTAENLFKLSDAVEANARWILVGKEPDGREIPMGKPLHVDPEESDLLYTFRQLPEPAKEELLTDAHKYLRLTSARPTKANPYPQKKIRS